MLERVRLLHEVSNEVDSQENSPTPQLIDLLRYFFRTILPPRPKDIKTLRNDFRVHLLDQKNPLWEKNWMCRMWIHMCEHDEAFEFELRDMLEETKFKDVFYKTGAEYDLKNLLKSGSWRNKYGSLVVPFQHYNDATPEDLEKLMDILIQNDSNLNEPDKVHLYKVMMASSILNKNLMECLIQKLQNQINIPINLALLWERMYPKMSPKDKQFLRYDRLIFEESE